MNARAVLPILTEPCDRDGRQPLHDAFPGSGARPDRPRVDAAAPGTPPIAPGLVRGLDVTAKAVLLVLLGLALVHPDLGNMEDKASGLRAVTYPMLAFALPATWWLGRRDRGTFPWTADLMVTITLFTDILGNRMDLFDTVVWFDDLVHVSNPALLTAAVLLLTVPHTATLRATLDRALAFGMTASVAWEVAEYAAFISESTERRTAYPDTLGDLALGAVGAVVAALVVHARRRARWVTASA